MANPAGAETTALSTRSGHDCALDAALERLTRGGLPRPAGGPGAVIDRPDSPELHITACRRLPPIPAEYASFPDAVDPLLRDALAARGVSRLYVHQAEAV